MILPAVALATIPLSIIARITRSALLEVMGKDYIRTARAKGVKERVVVSSHAFRNAMLPVVTIIGLQLGALWAAPSDRDGIQSAGLGGRCSTRSPGATTRSCRVYGDRRRRICDRESAWLTCRTRISTRGSDSNDDARTQGGTRQASGGSRRYRAALREALDPVASRAAAVPRPPIWDDRPRHRHVALSHRNLRAADRTI